MSEPNHETISKPPDFSVVAGGPLFQLWRRAGLSGDALELTHKRIVVTALLCWLPLLVLSALDGQLLGTRVAVPFLLDLEAHIKFLLVVPMLIAAEFIVHRHLRFVVAEFLERQLIPADAMPRFTAAFASGMRLRNSVPAEMLLIAAVYFVGIQLIWSQHTMLNTATWYATPAAGHFSLSLAGVWYGYVSLPIFQFLLCRWYFRLFVWVQILWKVSRIRLNLIPSHPDGAAGLGFLGETCRAFMLLAIAHGTLVAGQIVSRIVYLGASLADFKLEIAAVVSLLFCMLLGPLLLFAPQLARAKRVGDREYGRLAHRYVREFDHKWLRGGAQPDEPFMGSADIQSLADMGGSYELVSKMHIVPITSGVILQLAAATLAPILPLILTMMPLKELLQKLLGILF